jgi:two-component system sporulation sensor kinase C
MQTKRKGSLQMKERQIAICVADPISQRLIEGIASQLELEPVFLEIADLGNPDMLDSVEVLLVDEPEARKFAQAGGPYKHRRDGLHVALVAVTPALSPEGVLLPKRETEEPFDGVIALPQRPSVALAQLSVILYAHRAYVLRYQSAVEELNLNRRIFRSVTSGISVADALHPDLPLVYVNPAFEVMTGYSLEEIIGRNCRLLQGKDRDQPGLTQVREALREKREVIAVVRNYRKDGSAFWNELSLSPIRDRTGEVTHFVGIQNDVSARIAFEDALRESEKLAAVGRLAASIAHEINNPLESVTNLLYLAEREKDDEQRDEFLQTAQRELHRVSQLTTQSLRFYKQSTRPQAIRPTELISAVLDVYKAKMAKMGIVIERQDAATEPIVCLESEVRQVISNLVRNAMDAMSGKGCRLLVRSRMATEWQSGRKGITITVADNGSGMSPETREHLYTAFFTTKGIGGTGLGLWVSSGIIQRHYGRLSVKSSQGQRHGTVFSMFLPQQGIAA